MIDFKEEMLRLVEIGYSTHKIAKELGVGQTTIRRHLAKLNVKTKVKSGPNRDLENLYCKKCGLEKEKRSNWYCNKCTTGRKAKITEIKENTSPKTIRRILLDKREHRCESCKRKTWMGKSISLQVHHVDGNSDNNDENNLKLLCPNCHSQTPNFMGKNIGTPSKRSKYRRSYYYS